jgi:hypothetical protein
MTRIFSNEAQQRAVSLDIRVMSIAQNNPTAVVPQHSNGLVCSEEEAPQDAVLEAMLEQFLEHGASMTSLVESVYSASLEAEEATKSRLRAVGQALAIFVREETTDDHMQEPVAMKPSRDVLRDLRGVAVTPGRRVNGFQATWHAVRQESDNEDQATVVRGPGP